MAQRLGVEPVLLASLRERSYGVAEGKPQTWLEERFVPPPSTGDLVHRHDGIDGAETKHQFASRIYATVSEILSRPCSQQVVVTHGFALTFVVTAWIHLPLASAGYVNLRSSNRGITVLEQDGFFHNRTVVTPNDTSHPAAV
ncbi:histidine phosphatase family protein [Geodermatophilus sp. URMC 61]|uniref:histidine phosphatase family protein n=1 Tax=Geodermatophilus sp. URMC 61 TaxID=3423411 RepID=UPI00406C484C